MAPWRLCDDWNAPLALFLTLCACSYSRLKEKNVCKGNRPDGAYTVIKNFKLDEFEETCFQRQAKKGDDIRLHLEPLSSTVDTLDQKILFTLIVLNIINLLY